MPAGPWLLKDLRGGYTVATPAADGERVYVLFGSSVAAALDADGKIVWRKEIAPFAFDVAAGTSPVLYRDTVLLQWDQTNKTSRLIALDRKTGDVKWEKKRPDADWTHSTPVLAEVKGKKQLLVASAVAVQGLDPDNGDTIWSCGLGDKSRVGDTVSPVLAGGVVYCDSGRGGPGVAVDPTGEGDVTKTHLKWKVPRVPEGFGSPVAFGDYLYRLTQPRHGVVLEALGRLDGLHGAPGRRRGGAEPVRHAGRPRLLRQRRQKLRRQGGGEVRGAGHQRPRRPEPGVAGCRRRPHLPARRAKPVLRRHQMTRRS